MITLILGDVGTGKTLLMCLFSQISSRKVFTNFQIRDSNKKIQKFSIRDVLDEKIDQSDVFIDEFYLYMDSRHFMNDINSLLSYFAFQSRKLGLRIYLSTQIIRTIDIRMREMIDCVVECEVIKDTRKIAKENPLGISGFKYNIYTGVNSGNYSAPKQLFLAFDKALEFFDKYDTYEIIKTPLFETIKRNVAVNEYTDAELEQIAKECIKFLKKKKLKITKTNVAVFCQKMSYSTKKEFVNSIYADSIILTTE